ncbi:hypothetical protein [Paucihalobacter sp.]|uniref:hypothetical protein n=1 Tax=Paucihalobacter sp. TaxID=2850405 RepID=UPI002FE420C7
MNIPRFFNYIFILLGGLVAIYAQAGEAQNEYLLISGIVLLMIGLYRISRNLSSKSESTDKPDDSQDLTN